jgi:HK97 family phage major capsid protein
MSDSFVKSQQEVRANLTEQIRDVIESAEKEGRGLDAAELEKIDRIEADIRRADEAISVAKRNEERKLEASVAAKGFIPSVEVMDDSATLRSIARGEIREYSFAPEQRTLVNSDNTVPKSFYDEVFAVARLVGPMLDVSQIINTTSGESLTVPTLTQYSTATLATATATIGVSDPIFSSITLNAYKYAHLLQASNELVADAGFPLASFLAEQAGNALGFAVNAALTTGDGSDKPNGVVTAAGSGITGATSATGTFTADDLINLQYTLDGAARRLPGVAYMANTSTLGKMRTLKNGDDTYLYAVNVGAPDTFAGFPVLENPAMASVGTGNKSVLFGHMPSYKVRIAGGVNIASSTDYAFNQDVTTWRVLLRVDGDLTHAGHIKYFIGGAS